MKYVMCDDSLEKKKCSLNRQNIVLKEKECI